MKKMLLVVIAALATSLALTAVAGATTLHELEGKVVSVDRDARTFRLKDHDGRGTATIKVTRGTRFEDLSGFSALRVGLERVEVDAKRVDRTWVASKIELSGRDDDDRGGDDDRDDDDHDHGGRRHGGDDD